MRLRAGFDQVVQGLESDWLRISNLLRVPV